MDALVELLETGDAAGVRAYLHGVAAFCAAALRGPVDRLGQLTNLERTRISAGHPRVAALGRLHSNSTEASVSNSTLFEASSTTVSQLQQA